MKFLIMKLFLKEPKKFWKIIRLKKIKNRFLIIGSEVPLSGSGDSKKIVITNMKQIANECKKFRQVLKNSKFERNRKFGLVVEPGMKYMHKLIKKPDLKKFFEKKFLA